MNRCGQAGALSAVLLVAGCGASLPPRLALPPGDFTRASASETKYRGAFLYVAGTKISQYRLGSSTPVHSIEPPQGTTVTFAMDRAGELLAESITPSWGSLAVYDPSDLTLKQKLDGVEGLDSFAFDSRNYLYAGTCGWIAVFKPGAEKFYRSIRGGPADVCALAIDSGSGTLYAANSFGHSVDVYGFDKKPGRLHLLSRISRGIHNPFYLVVDRSGRLFVGNCVSCYYSSPPRADSISVYMPGQTRPQRIIKDGIAHPLALALDSKNRLLVGNSPFESGTFQPGWVSVYADGATKPLRMVTDGINYPSSIAVDPSDNIYVANTSAGTVTEYSPGGVSLESTITKGVGVPFRVVIGAP